MKPGYIRMLAKTCDDDVGEIAKQYLIALLHIAPVRLVSVSGGLEPGWDPFARFLATPMQGEMINVVCCDSAQWAWTHRVPMAKSDVFAGAVTPEQMRERVENGTDNDHPVEVAQGRIELYTVGVHNVLIAINVPRSKAEIAAAQRYDRLLVPNMQLLEGLQAIGMAPDLIPIPVNDRHALRRAIAA